VCQDCLWHVSSCLYHTRRPIVQQDIPFGVFGSFKVLKEMLSPEAAPTMVVTAVLEELVSQETVEMTKHATCADSFINLLRLDATCACVLQCCTCCSVGMISCLWSGRHTSHIHTDLVEAFVLQACSCCLLCVAVVTYVCQCWCKDVLHDSGFLQGSHLHPK